MKSTMEDIQEGPYCASLKAVRRGRYKLKIRTYVRYDPYVMKRSDLSIELKDFQTCYRGSRYKQLSAAPDIIPPKTTNESMQ